MNAGLLISAPTGSNGPQAAGQPATDTSKTDIHSSDTSFGHVLAQVGKQADRATDTASTTSVTEEKDQQDQKDARDSQDAKASKHSTDATDTIDATPAPSSLQMTLALQASALAVVQMGQDGSQVKGDGQTATGQADGAQLVATVVGAQQAILAVQAGSATSAKAGGPTPVVATTTTLGNGALPSAADKAVPTAASPSVDPHPSVPLTTQPDIADLIATGAQRDLLTTTSDKGSTQAPNRSAVSEPAAQATDSQAPALTQGQGVASGTAAQEGAAQALSVVTDLNASGRDAEPPTPAASSLPRSGAGVQAGTMAEANINLGQPIQTPFEQNAAQQAASQAQTGLQDRTVIEQARPVVLSGHVDKSQEFGKGQKEAQAPQPTTGAERFGFVLGEGQAARNDGTIKVTATAPVAALPTEPVTAQTVQSLRLEVERPGIGGVQVHVVLADQTVHAKVTTGQVEVRDFLIARQDQLAGGLKASGLEMGDFQVDVGAQGRGQSGPGWFAGAQGDQAGREQRPPEPQTTPQPLFVEPRAEQWSGYSQGVFGGTVGRQALNVFA